MRIRSRNLLCRYMIAAGMTQSELAKAAGCSRQFIHLMLSGARQSCTYPVAVRIERALRVRPGTLFVPGVSTTSTVVPRVTGRRIS
jgi:DNA-binding XRE family transcriptional regulator